MPRTPDQSELLALVEGELTREEAARLRAALSDQPDLLAGLDAMTRDRGLLRSMTPLTPPRDFVADLEPVLARPLLIQPTPGVYRRRHNRGRRRRELRRLVAAAAILIAGAGLGVAAWSIFSSSSSPSIETAPLRVDRSTPRDTPEAAAPSDPATMLAAGTIHHARPAAVRTPSPSPPAASRDVPSDPITLPFVLAVEAQDETRIEPLMIAAIRQIDADVALVRNFSWAEARQIEQRWALAHGQRSSSDPIAVAALDGAPSRERLKHFGEIADRVAAQVETTPPSAQLVGERSMAPDFARQLEISSSGAGHTITMRLSEVAAVLDRLRTGELSTTLRRTGDAPPAHWSATLGAFRAELQTIRDAHGDAVVHLPVAIHRSTS